MFRDEGVYRDLIIVFREGGSIKLPNYQPRSSDRLEWEWHGEAGKAIRAVSSFLKDVGDRKLPKATKKVQRRKAGRWVGVPIRDDSVLPIELAIDRVLHRAKTQPTKSRALNPDGSLRCIVYAFAKGAVIELYECRKWRLRGDLHKVYIAALEAAATHDRYLVADRASRPMG